MTRIPVMLLAAWLLAASAGLAQDDDGLKAARALYDAGKFGEAAAAYEALIPKLGRTYEVLMGFGLSLFHQHENRRSLGYFTEASRARPDDARARLYMALTMHRTGEDEIARGKPLASTSLHDAVIAYREAAERSEDPYEPRFWAAELLLKLDRAAEALVEAEAALAARKGDVAAKRLRAMALFGAGRYEDYLAASRELGMTEADELPRSCSELMALARLGRVGEATSLFVRLLAPDKYAGRIEPYRVLSEAWSDERRLPAQIAALDRVLEAHPEEALARYFRGYAHALQSRFDAAVADFAAYLEKDPNSVTTLGHQTRALLGAGRVEEAHAAVRQALVLASDDETVHADAQSVVAAYVEKKDFEAALKLHELVVTAAPDDPDVARNHAILMKDLGRLDHAADRLRDLVENAVVENDRLAGYMNDLALCLKGLGKIEEAEEMFRRSGKTWGWEADARENLGVLKYEQGRLDEAKGLFEEVLEIGRARKDVGPRHRSRYYLRMIRAGRKGA